MVSNTFPTSTADGDMATENLPVANVKQGGSEFPDDEFTTIPNVPVFAEHKTIAKNGRELRFGRKELEAIVYRCNRRINQTGDYAALTIGHTPSPEAMRAGAGMPDLVGFAGPYRLGVLGNEGQQRRYAILADFHVFKEEMPRVRKNPRRSPELWLEDQYEEMFFDPISLLGSEAPRLDLGLLYSATRHDGEGRSRVVEKYAAVAPSASNVFISTHGDKLEDKKEKYQPPIKEEPPMALGPEDVKQIVDALEQLDWVQGVKELLSNEQSSPGSLGQGIEGPPPGFGAENGDDPMGMEQPAGNGMEPNGEPAIAGGDAFPKGGGMEATAPDFNGNGNGDDLPMAPPENEMAEPTPPSVGLNAHEEAPSPLPTDQEEPRDYNRKYQAEKSTTGVQSGEADQPGTRPLQAPDDSGEGAGKEIDWPLGDSVVTEGTKKYTADDGEELELDEEDQDELKAYMARKYAANQSVQESIAKQQEFHKDKNKKYDANGGQSVQQGIEKQQEFHKDKNKKYGADGDISLEEGSYGDGASVEGNEFGTDESTVEGSVKSQDGDAQPSNGSAADEPNEAVAAFSKGSVQEQLRYTRSRLHKAEQAISRERAARSNAERFSALKDARSHYVFDLDREMGVCQYSKMNETQWQNHLETISQNYQPIPIDTDLRVFGDIDSPSASGSEKYSRDLSDQAYKICERRQLDGEAVDYEEVLQGLRNGATH